MRNLFVLLLFIFYAQCSETEINKRDSIINIVNSAKTTWKAGHNFEPYGSQDSYKPFLGTILDHKHKGPYKRDELKTNEPIPKEFDARKKWPKCKSIGHVRDQGPCGSCWAVAAAETFTDRYCISTGGKENPAFSALDLLSCCNDCGHGCDGGNPWSAWRFFQRYGVVTGSDYLSKEGCKPYSFEPCGLREFGKKPQCSPHEGDIDTPTCHYRCSNNNYHRSYFQDRQKVKDFYYFGVNNTEDLQRDMMKYGPVEASFNVYEDFPSYRSGVYQHITGKQEGGHSVKLIGWGVENDVPYWLAVNSWNTYWGENGLFKIKRGNNECDFESFLMAGIPKKSGKNVWFNTED